METNSLKRFIEKYIHERCQLKLEPFDKATDKQLSAASAEEKAGLELKLFEERRSLEMKYDVRTWLTDAAARAGQISLVTHAVKYFHGDAKGSSIYSAVKSHEAAYLSTTTLHSPSIDAVGNSAALDVAKLLQTEHEGDSLLASLKRGDFSALAALAENEAQLAQWMSGFMQALSDKSLSTHQFAKQLYFPVSDTGDYHLLSPLYSSSLAHALYQRISHSRYSEASVAARKARREGLWHPEAVQYFPDLAVQNMGGTKPQNISYLNSTRGGKNHLLRCAPPQWQQSLKPPVAHKTFLTAVSSKVTRVVTDLRRYLHSVYNLENTMEIRQQRAEYVDELIGMIFSYAAEIQSLTTLQGWSLDEDCLLKTAHQLWLDPLRQHTDPDFKLHRERGEWISEIAEDFAHWLNTRLNKDEKLNMGAVEFRDWSVLMRRRLREFDAAQQENWQ
ncbi:type I-F CRISPR-associated protein Csy1 [Rahnella woolbedingensis]|uniref:Type I-F CRISPR-associated protein Csy1 n=1 Tax=Rahnella woolbedingensis TaxID=1510574 RepID=A0A419NE73_9GAMM|nr:type I-F CRISPR-associated protein Csy1 [Rahnella woolbedingensis]RJT47045.1 type I-F CRISPR-associated protein Csy1 [Rahnella woolbedingensis]